MTLTTTRDEFELVTLKSGHKSLRSLVHNETFHPATGPFDEANVIHVAQTRLKERLEALTDTKAGTQAKFVIWDVGFGAAANVLAGIEAVGAVNPGLEIEVHSFDKTTAPIEFALSHHEDLGYLTRHREKVETLLRDRRVSFGPRRSWSLHLGDFSRLIGERSTVAAPNAIFYDPYSPATNPEMWTLEHFRAIAARIAPDSDCLLTNYTRSTSMRVALLLARFHVGVGCVIGEKAETTIAANRPGLLSRPLDRDWLKRVRASTNAAPLRGATYVKAPIDDEDFEALMRAPQFNLN